MPVNHQITLIAYVTDADGFMSICDIAETSLHYAPHFARTYIRRGGLSCEQPSHIAAIAPNAPLHTAIPRPIAR